MIDIAEVCILLKALGGTPRHFDILWLRIIEDKSNKDTAAELGLCDSRVRQLFSRVVYPHAVGLGKSCREPDRLNSNILRWREQRRAGSHCRDRMARKIRRSILYDEAPIPVGPGPKRNPKRGSPL